MVITIPTSRLVSHPSTRGWTLAFDETFPGSSINTSRWGASAGNALPWGDRNNAGATNTLQLYSSNNVAVSGGLCTITIDDEDPAMSWDSRTWDYSSAMLHTYGNFSFRYGWMEIRCKLPSKVGVWPAFWALEDDGAFPYNWELDVFEQFGSETSSDPASGVHNGDRILMSAHYNPGGGVTNDSSAFEPGSSGSAPENRVAQDYFTGGFHTFALNWQADRLEWFIDGVSRKLITDTSKIPDVDMYLLVNCDVDGDAAGDITVTDATLPVEYVIDYVKVWQ